METCSLHGLVNFMQGLTKLGCYRGGYQSKDFFALLMCTEYFHDVRFFHDGTIRASGFTFATEDAFVVIDAFNALLILGDGIYRAHFLAGHGTVNDGMEWALFHAFATVDTSLMVDLGLFVQEIYGVFGAVYSARPGFTSLAHVADVIAALLAAAAGFINHRHYYRRQGIPAPGFLGIFLQAGEFIFLIINVKAKQGHDLVLEYRPVFMNATPQGMAVFWSHF